MTIHKEGYKTILIAFLFVAAFLLALNDIVTRFTEYHGLVLGLVILAFAIGLRRGVLDFIRLSWPGRSR